MLDLNPFLAELRALCVSVWPEVEDGVGGGNVLEAEHANMVPWATLGLPYAVMLVERMDRGDWGADNLDFEVTMVVYYAAATRGASTSLRTKIETLLNAIWPTEVFTTAQTLDWLTLQWDDTLMPNQQFRASNLDARAGMLRFKVLIGVTQ